MGKNENIIGKTIRKYRNYQGLSRREVGDSLGVVQATVADYESGKIVPPIDKLKKLHKILDIPFMEFFPDISETTGYAAKLDEKLLKSGVLDILEKHPEAGELLKAYSKNAKRFKDIDLPRLLNKLASYPPEKRETALNILMKGKI